MNKGHADLHLEPFLARYPDVRYGYVLEIKYLKRGAAADEPAVAARQPRPRPRGSSDGLNPPDSRPGRIRSR